MSLSSQSQLLQRYCHGTMAQQRVKAADDWSAISEQRVRDRGYFEWSRWRFQRGNGVFGAMRMVAALGSDIRAWRRGHCVKLDIDSDIQEGWVGFSVYRVCSKATQANHCSNRLINSKPALYSQ